MAGCRHTVAWGSTYLPCTDTSRSCWKWKQQACLRTKKCWRETEFFITCLSTTFLLLCKQKCPRVCTCMHPAGSLSHEIPGYHWHCSPQGSQPGPTQRTAYVAAGPWVEPQVHLKAGRVAAVPPNTLPGTHKLQAREPQSNEPKQHAPSTTRDPGGFWMLPHKPKP